MAIPGNYAPLDSFGISYKIHHAIDSFIYVIMRSLRDMLFKLDACHCAFKIQGYSDIEFYSNMSSMEASCLNVFQTTHSPQDTTSKAFPMSEIYVIVMKLAKS